MASIAQNSLHLLLLSIKEKHFTFSQYIVLYSFLQINYNPYQFSLKTSFLSIIFGITNQSPLGEAKSE